MFTLSSTVCVSRVIGKTIVKKFGQDIINISIHKCSSNKLY